MTASTREGKGLAAAGIATVALTAPALAAELANAATYTKNECTGNRLCLWSQGGFANNWTRRAVEYDSNYNDNRYEETGLDTEDGLNDSVSAVWNYTNRYAMLFRNNTYGSNRICFPPGTAVRDLHLVKLDPGPIELPGGGDSWGNRISSHRIYSYRPSDCDAIGSTMVPASQYGCSM